MRAVARILGTMALAALAARCYVDWSRGPFVFVALGLLGLTAAVGVRECVLLVLPSTGRASRTASRILALGVLVVGGCAAGFLLLEVILLTMGGIGSLAGGPIEAAASDLAMPKDWEMRQETVPGAMSAFRWHGHLHVLNNEGFRDTRSYVREDGVHRIAVLGDSMTYGYGVAASEAYPAVLERLLSKRAPVRVYNMGRPGSGAAEQLEAAQNVLAPLEPNLVICALFLDDYVLSDDDPRVAAPFPIAESIKAPFSENTQLGRLVTSSYDGLLMKLGVRKDLFAHIFEHFDQFRKRARGEYLEMATIARRLSGRAPLGLVLDYVHFDEGEPMRRFGQTLDEDARAAGMRVVDIQPFRDAFHKTGREVRVSRWETHMNAAVHAKFAEILAGAVEKDGLLAQPLSKPRSEASSAPATSP